MTKKHARKPSFLTRLILKTPTWIGSGTSIVVHTVCFVGIFALRWLGFPYDEIMLILTTVVSLEAIYLSLFIQMTVNKTSESIEDVGEDIDAVQEDMKDLQEGVEGLETDVDELSEDIDKIQEEDQDQTSTGVDDNRVIHMQRSLKKIEVDLVSLVGDIKSLKTDIDYIKQHTNKPSV